ncbi:transposase [Gordonia sp. (in: high G+C Gram-positive bacteria)]|uniref:transposase n=1 Tax=Gordonia sp. (in: high G+C Gram-positive bacteria) TaxID=84139 RepID=UPI003F9ABA85
MAAALTAKGEFVVEFDHSSTRPARDGAKSDSLDAVRTAREILGRTTWPTLLDEPGVGVLIAAEILVSWSHPSRCRDEAAFARLGGVAPLEATSGQTQTRHRLSRGGDRQLNRALHTVILARAKHHQPTKDYLARRTTEGKTKRESMRCLKRYYTRNLFRLLEAAPMTP